MKKNLITAVVLLISLCLKAQVIPCDQTQVSNSFEGGARIDPSEQQLIADDFIVTSGTTSFTVESIAANFFAENAIDEVLVMFYADNGGLPGNQIASSPSITPTSQTVIGNSSGINIRRIVLDFPNPQVFSGNTSSDTTYWVSLIALPATSGEVISWELTSVGAIGNFMAFKNPSTNGNWFSSAVQGTGYDTVFKIEGTCTGEPLGSMQNSAPPQVSLYPNPFTKKLYIELPNAVGLKSAVMYGLDGKQIQMDIGKNRTLNTANLAPGVYVLKLKTSKGFLTRKVVKQ